MFLVEDNSIIATRGDIVFFDVTAMTQDETAYTFRAGDVLRMRIFRKKDCGSIMMLKDFLVEEDTEIVPIYLEEADTKFGELISKPTDYWYEIELNPETDPQTIVGYSEDGPAVFRLLPEGKDIADIGPEDLPWVDPELDEESEHPIQNQATAKEFAKVYKALEGKVSVIGDSMYGSLNMCGKKVTNVGTPTADGDAVNLRYARELFMEGSLTDEQVEAIIQEVMKEENTQIIVEQVLEEIPDAKNGATFTPNVDSAGNLSWTNDGGLENPASVNVKGEPGNAGQDGTTFTPSVDAEGNLSWTNNGGLENPASVKITGKDGKDGEDGYTPIKGEDYFTEADKEELVAELGVTDQQVATAVEAYMAENPVASGATEEQAAQIQTNKENIAANTTNIQTNTEAIEAMKDPVVSGTWAVETQKHTLTLTLESGGSDVIIVETDANDYPTRMTINGAEIRWTVTGV